MKQASAEGLAPQDRVTLRALKEKHPSALENLRLPNLPDGSVVLAVTTEEVFLERQSSLSMQGLLVGPFWPPSFSSDPWFCGGGIASSVHINRSVQRHGER